MEYDTMTRGLPSKTEIELMGILKEVDPIQVEAGDTSTPLPTSYDNTMQTPSNNGSPDIINLSYNRKVCRYARKHRITVEEAFKRLYK